MLIERRPQKNSTTFKGFRLVAAKGWPAVMLSFNHVIELLRGQYTAVIGLPPVTTRQCLGFCVASLYSNWLTARPSHGSNWVTARHHTAVIGFLRGSAPQLLGYCVAITRQ